MSRVSPRRNSSTLSLPNHSHQPGQLTPNYLHLKFATEPNTVHMSRIIRQLRATGVTITDEEVAFISPLAYAHVIPNGTYFFDRVGEGEYR